MQTNRKIRLAVATAVSLITIGLQDNAYALGFSEISVKSHLGQPFKAKINVLGASEIKDASCLKIVNHDEMGNHLSNGRLSLGTVVDDQATLTITSNQAIDEPILNFSIVAECESSFQRDYVVLLDPMMSNEVAEAPDEMPIAAPQVAAPVKKAKKKALKQEQTYSQTIIVGPSQSASGKKATSNDDNAVLNTAKQLASTNKLASASNSQPRLSISGGSSVGLAADGLHMDKMLTTTPDPNAVAVTNNPEISDDITAMNYRLVNLEKQLHLLQTENLGLKADNKAKAEQLVQANSLSAKLGVVLPILGGGLLLIGSYFGFSWWRRRQENLQEESSDTIWAEIHEDVEAQPSAELATTQIEQNIFDDIEPQRAAAEITQNETTSVADKSAAMEMSFAASKQAEDPILVEEDNSGLSVLDHVDVFLSHGRTSLAIQLLQGHLLDHPKQSVTIWLFLLDLLAKENLRDEYERTALECKEHFNVRISEFKKMELDASDTLEGYPRLCEGLQQVWNTMGSVVYLDDLIYNTRLEPRAGFEKNLIEELMLLKGIAQQNIDSAEIIILDDKKNAIKEQKEAQLAAKKAEKMQEMKEAMLAEQSKAEEEKKKENLFEFGMIEWK